MNKELLESVDFMRTVCDEINALDDYAEAKVYEGYSGRAMYGKTVHGISTDQPTTVIGQAVIKAAIAEFFDDWVKENRDDLTSMEVIDFIEDFESNFKGLGRQDSLGLGMIYY